MVGIPAYNDRSCIRDMGIEKQTQQYYVTPHGHALSQGLFETRIFLVHLYTQIR